MPMFTGSMSHKEVDFVNYIDGKFADLKEKNCKRIQRRFAIKHNVINK